MRRIVDGLAKGKASSRSVSAAYAEESGTAAATGSAILPQHQEAVSQHW